MTEWVVHGGRALRGRVAGLADASIAELALLFAAIGDGVSTLRGHFDGLGAGRVGHAVDALRALGVRVDDGEPGVYRVAGRGLSGLTRPLAPLEAGPSRSTLFRLAGLLAGQRFGVRISSSDPAAGDVSPVVVPLRARGALIAGTGGSDDDLRAPLSIAPLVGDEALKPLEHRLDVRPESTDVKTALLLSGLYARGLTAIGEPVLTCDHAERMMLALGLPIETFGPMTVLDAAGPAPRIVAFDWEVPGDVSLAVIVLGAALGVAGSAVVVEGVGVNPTRSGVLDAMRAMRARLDVVARGVGAGDEPVADLQARASTLTRGMLAGELLLRARSDLAVFAAIAGSAKGASELRDVSALGPACLERVQGYAGTLAELGVSSSTLPDGLRIEGASSEGGERVNSHGDPERAVVALLVALRRPRSTTVLDVDELETRYPMLLPTLRRLGAQIERRE